MLIKMEEINSEVTPLVWITSVYQNISEISDKYVVIYVSCAESEQTPEQQGCHNDCFFWRLESLQHLQGQ